MTALTIRPPRSATDPELHRRNEDRLLFAIALFAAGALHTVALLVPVPAGRAEPTVEPRNEPPRIAVYDIPPPPIDRVAPREPRRHERLLPVPDQRPQDPEPVREPSPVLEVAPASAPDPAWSGYQPVPPPPPGPLEESTPGLILPVPLPGRTQPEYPPSATRARVSGTVVLRAIITAQGTVERIELIESSRPDLGFSRAALEAVATWRYDPGLLDGRPVAVSMRVVVTFDLH